MQVRGQNTLQSDAIAIGERDGRVVSVVRRKRQYVGEIADVRPCYEIDNVFRSCAGREVFDRIGAGALVEDEPVVIGAADQ